MNKIFDSDGMEITKASWRSQFYGMIKEGHKERISPWFIKLIFLLIAVVALTLEMISGFKPATKARKSLAFETPQTIDPDDKLNVPLYELQKRGARTDSNGKPINGATRPMAVERLRAIKLSTTDRSLTAMQVQAQLSMGASNGIVAARLSQSLTINGELIFPEGTMLYGHGNSADERLFIEFKKAILPDRSQQKIKAQALDLNDQTLGIKGKKISDVAFKIAASSGLIFLSGVADGMKQSQDIFHRPSIQDAALNGVATAASRQGEKVLQDMQSQEQKVEVKTNTSILVMFDDFDGKE